MNISGNCSNSKHQCLSTAQTAQADALERINAPVLVSRQSGCLVRVSCLIINMTLLLTQSCNIASCDRAAASMMHSALSAALLRQRRQGTSDESEKMSVTCHALQLYAEDIELRLHDMVEVVGVYQYVPEVVALEFGGMTLDEVEKLTGQPPTFQPVPYLVSNTTLPVITIM